VPDEPKIGAPSAGLNASLMAVIDRMRDLAKWLVVVLGAIGGTLVAGSQLSDIGTAKHSHLPLAAGAVLLGLIGLGIAVGFVVRVLFPAEASLARLAKARSWSAAARLVKREPALLFKHGTTIADLATALTEVVDRESSAATAVELDSRDGGSRKDLETARRERAKIDKEVSYFLDYALVVQVRRRLIQALVAMAIGGLMVTAGICTFAWATHADQPDQPAVGAVPKQPSTVVVRLSSEGVRVLSPGLGRGCNPTRLHALAIGGEPGALDLVAIPATGCRPLRFTLTGRLGALVSVERVKVRETD
jgi:hypothetical protein